jgi:2-hydroxy-3-keto-5-methylthiopentenyl-1-phosphate phosphatase
MDFDGAICPRDVSEALLETFADPGWLDVEDDLRAGRIGLRETILRQASLLRADLDTMLHHAIDRFDLQPSFAPFVRWARHAGLRLAVATDGLGFYIEPMLTAGGIDLKPGGVAVYANRFGPRPDGEGPQLTFPRGHPRCVGCGTCKMNAVLEQRRRFGPVAFVGEGHSDRYGALYADVTFAKHHLVDLCRGDGVPFLPWDTFDDVRAGLERLTASRAPLPGPVAPTVCPGWTEPQP